MLYAVVMDEQEFTMRNFVGGRDLLLFFQQVLENFRATTVCFAF